jgi:hypothetical protein
MVLWAHDVHLPDYTTRLAAIEFGLPTPLLAEGLAPWPPAAPEPPEDGTYL